MVLSQEPPELCWFVTHTPIYNYTILISSKTAICSLIIKLLCWHSEDEFNRIGRMEENTIVDVSLQESKYPVPQFSLLQFDKGNNLEL